MKKSKKPEQFIKKPTYLKGKQHAAETIRKNLRYPKEAVENRIEGIVQVKCDINHRGKVVKTKIKSGLGYGCDEEAERLCKLLQFEAISHRGMRVTFHKTVNIRFNLKDVMPKQQLNYSYTPTKKEPPSTSEEKEGGNNSYGYTIRIN